MPVTVSPFGTVLLLDQSYFEATEVVNMHGMDNPSIIYIAGYGRSGSTVLDILLGNHQDIVSLGEVAAFFGVDSKGTPPQCACGQETRQCDMWGDVYSDFESRITAGWDELQATRLAVESIGALPKLLFSRNRINAQQAKQRELYCQQMCAMFQAVSTVTGKHIVVDSSKTAWLTIGRPLALTQLCNMDVKVIHLVREGRAVMWSGKKGTNRALLSGKAKRSSLRGYKITLAWACINFLTSLILKRLGKDQVMVVHYEQLVENPADIIEKISEFTGLEMGQLHDHVAANNELQVGHLMEGNRLSQRKSIQIRADYSWNSNLSLLDHIVYYLFFWPAALVYHPKAQNSRQT